MNLGVAFEFQKKENILDGTMSEDGLNETLPPAKPGLNARDKCVHSSVDMCNADEMCPPRMVVDGESGEHCLSSHRFCWLPPSTRT